jgi:transglutaminase superfamily protein
MRRLLTLAVVGTWIGMMGMLVLKQAPSPGVSESALPPAAVGERDEWFGVLRDGRRVGHAHRVTSTTTEGQKFSEESVLALAMLGTPQTVRTSLVAETDTSLALRGFRFTLVSAAAVFTATGTVDGRRLKVSYGPEGEMKDLEIPLTEPIQLASTLRPRVLAGDLTAGTRYTMPVFNPLTVRNEPMTVTVDGMETVPGPDGPTEAVRLVEEHQGVKARAWLTRDGAVLREEGSLGFTLERETREQALTAATGTPLDLATTSRIPLEGRIASPRSVRRLALRVQGMAADRIPDDPPRQRMADGVLRIEQEVVPAHAALSPSDPELASYLAPTPFIESDDAGVRATARSIVGKDTDARAVADRLVVWVNEHVEQVPSVTVPSAREVLESLRGDCNEHAVLLVALARAAGIPARVVGGAMYVEGGFYYHAWAELWLGRWVSADSVFRQMPTDATHVKLVEGGPEQHLALAEVVGRLAFATEEDPRR